uniref:Uncharacterized protein n=1 Tax=Candidatus Methanogaster sp. ANME-2c ERB4 TaxID=2759911 RepID=A0A7G9Y1Y2_9EURY|nr:hypothetical protein NNDBAHDD_00001 [Methanosarcinales archaeon ANME-2c ERB4]
MGVSNLESFIPSLVNSGIRSLSIATPAIIIDPMTGPFPASSTPAISIRLTPYEVNILL